MKYIKTYDGVVTGSFAGRDDGYPETKYVYYNNFEMLAKDFGTQRGERYFMTEEMDYREVEKKANEVLERMKEKEKEKEKLLKEKKEIEKRLRELN